VLAFGLAEGDVELIARIPALSPICVAKQTTVPGSYALYVLPAGPGLVAAFLGTAHIPAAHPHFPYGFVVDPD